MLLLLGRDHFSVEKMHKFNVFNECVTDQPTDRPTDQPTDRAYYRDARTHLKISSSTLQPYRYKNTRRRRFMPDSEHMMFVRPIVNKYNPNCTVVSDGSKILQSEFIIRVKFKCRRKDCDFFAVCSVDCKLSRKD